MKKGLLHKESPEPLHAIQCWECQLVFHDRYSYQKHRAEIHNTRLTISYEKYESKYSKSGWVERYHKEWVEIGSDRDQGRMNIPHELPLRPKRRILFTAKELENRGKKKTCHCGKPVTPPMRKYCSNKCVGDWYKKTMFVNQHRDHFLSHHDGVCEHCGKKFEDPRDLEMDHIIAIVLGGHPWHEDNMQGLCYDCHKIKTKSDMGILAWWKRQSNYDIGFKTNI